MIGDWQDEWDFKRRRSDRTLKDTHLPRSGLLEPVVEPAERIPLRGTAQLRINGINKPDESGFVSCRFR